MRLQRIGFVLYWYLRFCGQGRTCQCVDHRAPVIAGAVTAPPLGAGPDSSAGAPVYQLRHGNKYGKGRNGGLFGGNATVRDQDEN
jgi:hypothetical protein